MHGSGWSSRALESFTPRPHREEARRRTGQYCTVRTVRTCLCTMSWTSHRSAARSISQKFLSTRRGGRFGESDRFASRLRLSQSTHAIAFPSAAVRCAAVGGESLHFASKVYKRACEGGRRSFQVHDGRRTAHPYLVCIPACHGPLHGAVRVGRGAVGLFFFSLSLCLSRSARARSPLCWLVRSGTGPYRATGLVARPGGVCCVGGVYGR